MVKKIIFLVIALVVLCWVLKFWVFVSGIVIGLGIGSLITSGDFDFTLSHAKSRFDEFTTWLDRSFNQFFR